MVVKHETSLKDELRYYYHPRFKYAMRRLCRLLQEQQVEFSQEIQYLQGVTSRSFYVVKTQLDQICSYNLNELFEELRFLKSIGGDIMNHCKG